MQCKLIWNIQLLHLIYVTLLYVPQLVYNKKIMNNSTILNQEKNTVTYTQIYNLLITEHNNLENNLKSEF